jgi:hypothetical protein
VPKLRLTLSSTISSTPKSGKLIAVIAGSVLAVAVLAAVMAAPSARAGSSARFSAAMVTNSAGSIQALRQVRVATALAQAGSTPNQQAPQQIARKMLHSFGWTWRQFKYLNLLWDAESSWNVSAENPSTGAFGIPQAVPGSKMSAAGPDWQTDAATQIRWGLGYISAAYGSPRSAWEHEVTYGWY